MCLNYSRAEDLASHLFLVAGGRNAVAAGKRAGEVRLIGKAHGSGDIGGKQASGEKLFGAPRPGAV
ncbi:hypothetical protein BN130_2314 [Cronobacter malonaticus 507]|nr:hypothetical protein BN130_2314 [Cronobacter malonaticus 507]